jgi:hypothetical protein
VIRACRIAARRSGIVTTLAGRLSHPVRSRLVAGTATLTVVVATVISADVALAHDEDARLFVEPSVVAPGGGIKIDGQAFSRGLELELRLDGIDADASLAMVRTDPAGGFHVTVRIPTSLAPAVYAVVARSRDGDEINTNVVVDRDAGMGVPVSGEGDLPLLVGIVFGVAVLAVIGCAAFTRVRAARRTQTGSAELP